MEKFLNGDQSIPSLLAGIILALCLNLLFGIGKFLWALVKKKSETSEKTMSKLATALEATTSAMEKLDLRLAKVEMDLKGFDKFKIDLRRLFSAAKFLAGADWPKVRKQILEDELPHG